MVLDQEPFNDMAIRLKTIRPEVLTHQAACSKQLFFYKGQGDLGRRGIGQAGQRYLFGLLKCLVDGKRQPWMLLDQCFTDTEQMHDRKNPGAFVPVLRLLLRIFKQIPYMGMAIGITGGCPRTDDRIQLAFRQHMTSSYPPRYQVTWLGFRP